MQTYQTNEVETLIEGLNEDLSAEYGAMIQYLYNASVVSGLSRRILKPFFEEEAQDEMRHALYLSEKINYLGGQPSVRPKAVKHVTGVREMLQHTLQEEIDTIDRYKKRIDQAEQVGDIALKVQLEDMISDETRHKEEIERLLKENNL
ncbi:bacterioferritin [Seinonella peptonophila]|uniref:Bacterioferritin n=1 Tax=Seinonella peptonophila TaxID=112248 RepID=A0A1M4XM28_9BACL|nr:ferritin-like domain-containing protein [Seinonella peptonophila]SHE94529.1 bacterioferritin [Seinonella peptonophila]